MSAKTKENKIGWRQEARNLIAENMTMLLRELRKGNKYPAERLIQNRNKLLSFIARQIKKERLRVLGEIEKVTMDCNGFEEYLCKAAEKIAKLKEEK